MSKALHILHAWNNIEELYLHKNKTSSQKTNVRWFLSSTMAAGKAATLKKARKTEARKQKHSCTMFRADISVLILTRRVIIFHKMRKAKQTKCKFNHHDLKEGTQLVSRNKTKYRFQIIMIIIMDISVLVLSRMVIVFHIIRNSKQTH